MAVYEAKQARDPNAATSDCAGEDVTVRGEYTFATAVTMTDGDIIELVCLPPRHVVTSIELDNDAMGASCVAAVGILNDNSTAVDVAGITGAALSSAGVKYENSQALRQDGGYTDSSRIVGVEITTSAGAALTIGAKIGVTVRYRPKPYDMA